MKAKFGAIVVDGRGKIGGHVASKNKAGSYFRTKVTPTNPNTSSQSGVRSSFASLSQGWRGLTQAQRDSWNAGAVNFPYVDIFGDSKQLSGFGLYMQLNGNLANVGIAPLVECPSPASVESFTSLSFENDGGALTINSVPATIPVGFSAIISATAPLSAGRAFSKSALRKVQTCAPGGGITNFQDNYDAVFGSSGDGTTNIYASAFMVNNATGQVSQAVIALGLPA